MRTPGNHEIAAILERVAELLHAQHADIWRVSTWRNAGARIADWPEPVASIAARGALTSIPGIGHALAAAIEEIVRTGQLRFLQRLEGEVSPEDVFRTVPGIGEELARRLHESLGVESLADLEAAAHDGRLARVPGIGPRRARAIRDGLAAMLSRAGRPGGAAFSAASSSAGTAGGLPPIALLLDVDAEYRRRAEAGELKTITPKRFNPKHEAWLPVMHVDRDGWSITALFSNTARAHEAGKTHDWVVLYVERDGHESQCTVVTETHGAYAGHRVVRGREAESAEHIRAHAGVFHAPQL
ncbi:MAG TPA: helix-hairpin-helix domain-containing protein [bacterium]|nr:helix-hairpin-helix domain-containing protein [bacterium]